MAMTPNPYLGRQIAGAAGLLFFGLACHTGAHFRSKSGGLSWLLFAIVVAAIINAVEGLLQWFGLVGELYHWVIEPERRGIAFGALRQTNLFATFMCVGSVCTIWLVHRSRLTESMAWFISVILMFAVAASASRTGMLEVIALALSAFVFKKQQSPVASRLMVGQLVLLGLASIFLPVVAEWHGFGFSSGAERVSHTAQDLRLVIWSNTTQMIFEHPWLGWGWRETGYGHYMTLFMRRYDGLLDHSHNLPLQIALEFGLPIAVLFCGLLLRAIYWIKPWGRLSSNNRELSPPLPERQFAWIILLFIVGIHSMLEYPLWYAGFLFLTGLFLGYLLPVSSVEKSLNNYTIFSIGIAVVVAVSLICLAIVAWRQYVTLLPIYKTPFTNNRDIHRAAVASAINQASGAWLFREQLEFAALGLIVVTPKNAAEVRQRAEKLLHFSAEPMVIQPLLLSLWYLHDADALRFHTKRFCHAFPLAFERWRQAYARHPMRDAAGDLSEACRPKSP